MISLRRRVFRNSVLNLLASVSQRAGQALVFILIARFLSDQEAGAYNLANSYTSILLAFSLWGLDQILIREVAKREESAGRYVSGFLLLRLGLSLFLWAVLALIMPLLPYSVESKQLILIMALSIVPTSLSNLYQSVWIAFEDVRAISAIMLFFSLIRVVGGAALLFLGRPILWIGYLFFIVSVGELAANVWITYGERLGRRVTFGGWRPDPRFWAESMRTATPLIIVSLVLIVEYQFDVVILSFFRPEAQVGVYSKASMLLTLLLFLTRSYQLAIFPVISRAYEQSRSSLQRVYGRSLTLLVGGALVIAALVVAFAEPVMQLLYGPGNEQAATIWRILVWAFLISAFNVPNSRLIIAANRQKVIAYFAIMSMTGNVLLSLWLVPLYGGIGSAIARVAAMPLYSVPAFYYVQRHICPLTWRHLLPGNPLQATD